MNVLQLRVTNKKNFDVLSNYAFYASKLTGVMGFDMSKVSPNIPELQEEIEKSDIKSENISTERKYFVDFDYSSKKIYITAPFDYISFCKAIPIKGKNTACVYSGDLDRVYILIKYGLIDMTPGFKSAFPKWNEEDSIENMRYYGDWTKFRNEPRWSFKKYFTEMESGIKKWNKIKNNYKDELFRKEKSKKNFIEIRGEIIDVNKDPNNQSALIKGFNGKDYKVKFHDWRFKGDPTWSVGNNIRVWVQKVYGDSEQGFFEIVDPEVLPDDLYIRDEIEFLDELQLPQDRTYPSSLYNKLYFEYKIRTKCYN